MKREIKFRVWTGLKMEYNIMAGFLGAFYVQGIDEKDAASMSPFNTKYFDTTPVMQYTGLKDKNGEEIYEGDIVSLETRMYNTIGKVMYEVQAAQYWIRWRQPETVGRYYPLSATYGDGEKYLADGVIVIGNIYENPELLTPKTIRG